MVGLHTFPITPYEDAWRWQQATARSVRHGGDEALALLQHPPVYTFGRRVNPEHLLASPEVLKARGAEVVESNRGGDVTFHGPGQLVGYPILDLLRRDLGPAEYVRLLEDTLIRACRDFGVEARRVAGRPGVWTPEGKIGAIGVRIEGGVSLHGFALNVDVDLSWFEAIVPCGLTDATVTSMTQCLGASPGIAAVTEAVARHFFPVFDVRLITPDAHLPPLLARRGGKGERTLAGAR
jgi:lipoate-protein ligase B